MRNGGQNGTVELFKEKIAYVLKSLDNSHRNTSVEEITQYFIERSGLLQVVENSNIDFIHRSFMEYLTASEVVLQEDWGYLLNCVDDESWLETIGLAIGLASNKQANLAIERILQKNGIKYLIIAAICASNRVSLDENLREQINDGLSLIIPPKDTNTCIEIAKIGDIMVQLLMCQNTYSLHEQLMCLYTLLRINTVQSLRVSFTFLAHNTHIDVLRCLGKKIDSYNQYDIENSAITPRIIDYIKKSAKAGKLIIPENFFRICA